MWFLLSSLAPVLAAVPSPTISVQGGCPGTIEITVVGGTPGGTLLLGSSEDRDSYTMPSGACAGTELELKTPRWQRGKLYFDKLGIFRLTTNTRAETCGLYLQVLDLETCYVSELDQLPLSPESYVGSYAVSSGPAVVDNPLPYSCQEACAQIYGGLAKDYSCSTSNQYVDHRAHVSGWGDDSQCYDTVYEDFVYGTSYDCGEFGCAYSAWVADQCPQEVVNHCWLQ